MSGPFGSRAGISTVTAGALAASAAPIPAVLYVAAGAQTTGVTVAAFAITIAVPITAPAGSAGVATHDRVITTGDEDTELSGVVIIVVHDAAVVVVVAVAIVTVVFTGTAGDERLARLPGVAAVAVVVTKVAGSAVVDAPTNGCVITNGDRGRLHYRRRCRRRRHRYRRRHRCSRRRHRRRQRH